MPNFVKAINISETDKAALESILRRNTVEARLFIRAKILLLKADNNSNEYIIRHYRPNCTALH